MLVFYLGILLNVLWTVFIILGIICFIKYLKNKK